MDIIPFWEKYSIDHEKGGYYTCLLRDGRVFDTDKFIWLQGRQAWTFSMLYNKVENNTHWLDIAKHGVEFLRDKGVDGNGNFYFSLTREGDPLIQAYNIFSDCFAAMAFGQYAIATGEDQYFDLARKTYNIIISRKDDPKGIYEKNTGARPLKGFALPMILSNLVMELSTILESKEVDTTINDCVHQVMEVFLDENSGLIFENVAHDGKHIDSFEGRLLNPGHGIEAMWFIMDIASSRQDFPLVQKAAQTIVNILEHSWDSEYGGIFYFMDAHGYPVQQLEWDQKLWWVHLETLVGLAKAFEKTGDTKYFEWYQKVHDYTWSHFPDPEFGEWYGYLSQDGSPLFTLKGGKWKGCFHVPRAMYQCWQSFDNISKMQ